jgi:hypothetical protein
MKLVKFLLLVVAVAELVVNNRLDMQVVAEVLVV